MYKRQVQYHLLLILWKTYLENLGYNEGNFITKGDLIDKILSYGDIASKQELSTAFRLFKKYSLIHYNENEDGEDMLIQLYPSLQFGWDVPQFETVARQYIKDDSQENSDPEEFQETEEEVEL